MLSDADGRRVRLSQGAILIDGRPTLVLCSSLFYFRIPRGLWRQRLRAVRAAGYNCIDVYVPWNYHETGQDTWDFSGERDVAAFLQLAADEGLWVTARPGPYICSEWDGGGLPAYLLTERGMRLRDNDPRYLRHVARWFDQILPILSRFQFGAAGTIIAVQLENELDFYDCADPRGYIQALRDMALSHGLRVPLIACAGQGDIQRATGNTPGVVPTCNFYPNDRDPGVEDRVAPYQALLSAQGWPLMVTETNRAHFLLRRLLSAGAKLLGPYLQVSGFNFGFTNGINNWGDPLAFMTSDYDFDGMIGPYGELRPEIGEARLLSHLIQALGPALATATPAVSACFTVETNLALVEGGPRALALGGGGLLLALPNLGATSGQARLHYDRRTLPTYTTLTIAPDHCPFVLLDFPLASWRADAAVAYATAELCGLRADGPHAVLAFAGVGEAEFVLPGAWEVETTGIRSYRHGDRLTLCFAPQTTDTATVRFASGENLRILSVDAATAARWVGLSSTGEPVLSADSEGSRGAGTEAARPLDQWSALELCGSWWPLAGASAASGATPLHLEDAGIGQGFGWYEARLPVAETITGFLVHGGQDVVSLYWGDSYQGTVVPGGADCLLPIQQPPRGDDDRLSIRAEIWGHSNFDDARLPGLRLAARKGVRGITAITRRRPISSNWLWYPDREPGQVELPADPMTYSAPIVAWGNGLTTRRPDHGIYVKTVKLSPTADTWALGFDGTQAVVRVWVNDQPCGTVDPLNPFIDVTDYVCPGEVAVITLHLARWHAEAAGEVTWLEGRRATDWTLSGGGEAALWSAATQAADHAQPASLPYRLAPGGMAWLFPEMGHLAASGDSWTLHCTGRNAKLTAFLNGRGVGRLWLPSPGRPVMGGGHNDALYLPAPWFQADGAVVALLVEAVARGEEAEITAVVAQRRP